MNYYNEWDKGAAAWLRELINAGHIPPGIVDERSITEVTKEDLAGFTQCHFFCGISGWPLALSLAGVPATVPLWTGSPPCQPFSVAGKQLGRDDPRHLAPAFLELIAQCRPQRLYGEQVAAAIGKHWLDALLIELEEQGYTCGAAVLPACSVGAPHLRERLFFGARLTSHTTGNLADRHGEQFHGRWKLGQAGRDKPSDGSETWELGDLHDARSQVRLSEPGTIPVSKRRENAKRPSGLSGISRSEDKGHSGWKTVDWIGCRDGKFRPVKPGIKPLVDGFSNRVAALRGIGNAIVPQVAAEFIKAFNGAIDDQKEKATTKN